MHSVVFGGFAPKELAVRIRDAAPKVIVTSSCGLEKGRVVLYRPLLAKALEIAAEAGHTPGRVIVHQRTEAAESLAPLGDDLDFDEVDLLRLTSTDLDSHRLASALIAFARRPSLRRRRTTRFRSRRMRPCIRCIPRAPPASRRESCATIRTPSRCRSCLSTPPTRGPAAQSVTRAHTARAWPQWTMRNFMRMAPGETYWTASDIGWVVGHTYIVYAPLLNGNTTVLYEGKPVRTSRLSACVGHHHRAL